MCRGLCGAWKSLLGAPESPRSCVPRIGPRLGEILLVSGIPGGATSHHPLRDAAPLCNLAVVRAHPVHGNRRQAPFFPVPGEAKPSGTELGGYGAPAPQTCAPVAEYSQLDQSDGVFDRRAPFHLAALDGRGMDHPDLPDISTSVKEGAIAGVFCGLELQSVPWDELALQQQKVNQPSTPCDPRPSTFPRRFCRRGLWRPPGSTRRAPSMSTRP